MRKVSSDLIILYDDSVKYKLCKYNNKTEFQDTTYSILQLFIINIQIRNLLNKFLIIYYINDRLYQY